MTDKVQKIKDWISKEQEGLMDAQGNFEYPEHEGAYHILCNLDSYIDSLQEEPVSKDLEEAALMHFKDVMEYEIKTGHKMAHITSFKAGAKWQEKQDQSTIELAEDHAMLAGMEKMKEEMMEKAVDMVVGYWMPNGLMLTVDEAENCYNIDEGDRVKVIVIKED